MLILYCAAILTGIISGSLLYISKKLVLFYQRPRLDIVFTIIRFCIVLIFLYTILQFHTTTSILLLGLFFISYIATVITLVNFS